MTYKYYFMIQMCHSFVKVVIASTLNQKKKMNHFSTQESFVRFFSNLHNRQR